MPFSRFSPHEFVERKYKNPRGEKVESSIKVMNAIKAINVEDFFFYSFWVNIYSGKVKPKILMFMLSTHTFPHLLIIQEILLYLNREKKACSKKKFSFFLFHNFFEHGDI